MQRHEFTTGPFRFEAGGELPSIKVVYHTSPRTYQRGESVVWICHALTADSDVEDWWPQLVGPGRLVDTDRYYVVCVNMLCSAYGSSGPAQGGAYFDFPQTTVRDIVSTLDIVRRHLGIERVDLLMGCSIGGFQAIEWAVSCPEVIGRALFVATAPRVSPWLSAGVEAQRMALEADPTFRAHESLEGGAAGLKCARAQALLTYRCYDGYDQTQAEADEDTLFAGRAASYERHQGDKLVARGFDAYSYYYLCNVLDSHNVGRGRGGVETALGRIQAECTVVSVTSDGLFPPQETQRWWRLIPHVEYKTISSHFGHDAILIEHDALAAIIKPLLP